MSWRSWGRRRHRLAFGLVAGTLVLVLAAGAGLPEGVSAWTAAAGSGRLLPEVLVRDPLTWEVTEDEGAGASLPLGGCAVGLAGAFFGSALAMTTEFPFRDPRRVFRFPGETSPPELMIVIDHSKMRLTLYENGEPILSYPVALGRPGSPSPVGEFRIIQKFIPFRAPFGTRWMRISVPWGNYGIHGTNQPQRIGSRVSAGCIRMNNRHVNDVYPRVPMGTLVVLRGPLRVRLRLQYGPRSMGQDVVAVQLMLRAAGFDPGDADGRYGPSTGAAATLLQHYYGLLPDGRLGHDELALISD